MGIVVPTYESFLFWYGKYKEKKCTKDHARQMVGFHKTKWYYLCRDFESGVDISTYF